MPPTPQTIPTKMLKRNQTYELFYCCFLKELTGNGLCKIDQNEMFSAILIFDMFYIFVFLYILGGRRHEASAFKSAPCLPAH